MNMKQAQEKYLRNARYNMHAENFLLLATIFGNDAQEALATRNVQTRDRNGFLDTELNAETRSEVIGYYDLLFPKEVEKVTLYMIRRSNEYWGKYGFWQLNQYQPNYYSEHCEACKVLADMPIRESATAEVIEVEIELS